MKKNSESRPVSCSQCTKSFRYIDDLKKHFDAKHARSIFTTTTNQTYFFKKQTAVIQDEKIRAEKTSSIINNSFCWSQLSEHVKPIIRSDTDSIVGHMGFATSTHIKSSSLNNMSSTVVQKQAKTEQHVTNSEKAISSRRQCSEKLETTHSHSDHFIKNNSASFLSTTNVSSNHLGDQMTLVREQMNSSEISTSHPNKLRSGWDCKKKCRSHNDDVSRSIEKDVRATLFNDVNPSSGLKNPIAVAQNRINTTDDMTTTAKASFSCSQCSKKFKVEADCDRHSIAKHGQPILSTTTKLPSLSYNQTTMVQAQTKRAEWTSNSINKSIPCSQCTKKFGLIADVKKHFDAKHTQSISSTTTHQASFVTDQTVLMQNKKKTAEHTTDLVHNLLSYSTCSEKVEPAASRDTHSAASQAESLVPTTTIWSRPLTWKTTTLTNQTQSTEHMTNSGRISFQCLQCPELFASVIARDIHFNAKHPESNLASSTKLSNALDSESTMTKDQTNTTMRMIDSVKTFSCWKCSKKFKSAGGRFEHFINQHATSIRSKIIELSSIASSRIEVVQDQIGSEKTTSNPGKKLFGCWECVKKFKSDGSLIDHYFGNHASFVSTTDIDPSGILQNRMAMAQERLASIISMSNTLVRLGILCLNYQIF